MKQDGAIMMYHGAQFRAYCTVLPSEEEERTLYKANGPSAFTVLTAQSRAPVYGASPVTGSKVMFIIRVLTTSKGFDAKEATTAAVNADAK